MLTAVRIRIGVHLTLSSVLLLDMQGLPRRELRRALRARMDVRMVRRAPERRGRVQGLLHRQLRVRLLPLVRVRELQVPRPQIEEQLVEPLARLRAEARRRGGLRLVRLARLRLRLGLGAGFARPLELGELA